MQILVTKDVEEAPFQEAEYVTIQHQPMVEMTALDSQQKSLLVM